MDDINLQFINAANDGNLELVKKTLKLGADIHYMHGETAFCWAIKHKHFDIAEYLLDIGFSSNHRDDSGWTPIMEAAMYGRVEIIDCLIKHGADIHLTNNAGNTALIQAVKRDRLDFVKRLIELGADVDHKNDANETAVSIAKFESSLELLELLESDFPKICQDNLLLTKIIISDHHCNESIIF